MMQNGLFPNSNLVGSFSERGLLDSRLRGNDGGGEIRGWVATGRLGSVPRLVGWGLGDGG